MWLLAVLLLADSTRSWKVATAPAESLGVVTTGTGHPVVLIPGLFGSAYGFRKVVPLLAAAGYQAIIVEPLGIGSSSRPRHGDYSLAAQAIRIGAALDSLGIRRALVVAHSIGGSIAFRLAYQRPELVQAVVSLEGGPAESATSPSFRRLMKFAPVLKVVGGLEIVRGQTYRTLMGAAGDTSWITDEVILGYTADAARDFSATIDAFRGISRATESEALAPHLGQIRCHVRLMIGSARHDAGVGESEVALLQRNLQSFVIDTVPGAGHFLHEERPDAVLRAVMRAGEATAALTGGNAVGR